MTGGTQKMAKSQIELQLKNYRLTTADILYHMPDHPRLLHGRTTTWRRISLSCSAFSISGNKTSMAGCTRCESPAAS
jgi:hypothetical protein